MSYHDDTTHLSKTALNVFIDSPTEYYMQFISGEMPRKQPTTRMMLGTIIHAMLLEQKKLSDIAIQYDESCFKKDGTLNGVSAAKFRDEHADKMVLRRNEMLSVASVLESVASSELNEMLTEGTSFEQEFRASVHGVKCKCKPDVLAEFDSRVMITDLKCMERIDPNSFQRSSRSFRYWLQDVHYSSVVGAVLKKPVQFRFVAIEMLPPYRVQTYWFDQPSREKAAEFHQLKLGTFQACQQSGDWSDNWISQMSVAPWEIGYSGEGELVEVGDDI